MEQPWNQLQREGGGGFAMGESSCHADVDRAMEADLCEVVDGALLMELMEDLPSSDLLLDGNDVDVDHQLSHVIQSLEAEIGVGADEPAVMMADDAGERLDRIEDVFSEDLDGYNYEEGAASSSFGYWPQVPSSLAGHDDAEGWCVYTNTNGYEGGGVLGYYDTVDHQSYHCCVEGSADHMYLPLVGMRWNVHI